ncbi:hypothetical protein GCM10009546_70470 [Actinomadura livida]|uniref:Uncharacterized protein n=1 Tax=Actinomadura livida TaxID=79909 RepID=A0ABN1FUX5_9ACTN|nr:hypothetical protein GCM10010208_66680 [Actinomadura livida]
MPIRRTNAQVRAWGAEWGPARGRSARRDGGGRARASGREGTRASPAGARAAVGESGVPVRDQNPITVEHNGSAFNTNIAEGVPTTYCRLGGRKGRRTGSR